MPTPLPNLVAEIPVAVRIMPLFLTPAMFAGFLVYFSKKISRRQDVESGR